MTPNAALATIMAQAIVDALDGGTLTIYDSGDVQLAQVTLPSPAGTVAAGVITWDMDPDLVDSSIDANGTASYGEIESATEVLRITVGTSGADLNLDTLTFVAGGTFTAQSLTTTVPSI